MIKAFVITQSHGDALLICYSTVSIQINCTVERQSSSLDWKDCELSHLFDNVFASSTVPCVSRSPQEDSKHHAAIARACCDGIVQTVALSSGQFILP
jgi:hypothetical protein